MATITQTISPFPTAPDSSKDTPPEFNAKADAFVNHQGRVYVAEVNNWATQANSLRDEVNTIKSDIDNTVATLPDGSINDTITSKTSVWSSEKVSEEIKRSSGVGNMGFGNIADTMLELPLRNTTTPKAGAQGVSFSRSTTATYIDMYGVVRSAAVDEARFTRGGIIIEPAATNEVVNQLSPRESNVTLVKDTTETTAPDLSQTAKKITGDGSANTEKFIEFSGSVQDDTDRRSFSVYIKKADTADVGVRIVFVGGTVVLRDASINLDSGTTTTGKLEKIGNGWYRFTTTLANNGTGNTTALLRVCPSRPGLSDSSESVYAWGAQIEDNPYATSYIPTTTAAVTRGADALLCDSFNNHPSIEAGSPFSFAIDALAYGSEVSGIHRVFYSLGFLESGASSYSLLRISSGVRELHYFRDGAPIKAVSEVKDGETYRIVVTVSETQVLKVYVNGILISSSTRSLSVVGDMAKKISIGCSTSGGQQIGGVISNFRVWGKELSEEEARLA